MYIKYYIIIILSFLCFFLPSSIDKKVLIEDSIHNINITSIIYLAIIVIYGIISVIKASIVLAHNIYFTMAVLYVLINTGANIILYPERFNTIVWAILALLVTLLSCIACLASLLKLKHGFKLFFILSSSLSVFILAQEIYFGLIVSHAPYITELVGPFGRIRTTIGAATATGHLLFLFYVVNDAINGSSGSKAIVLFKLVTGLSILLTMTRSAILMLFIYELTMILIKKDRKRRKLSYVPFILMIVIVFLIPVSTIDTMLKRDYSKRLSYFDESVSLLKKDISYVSVGTGFGTNVYRDIYRIDNFEPTINSLPVSPHNTFAAIMSELGVIGLFCFLLILIRVAIGYRRQRISGGAFVVNNSNSKGLLLGLMIYAILGLNTETLLYNEMGTSFAIIFFISCVYFRHLMERKRIGQMLEPRCPTKNCIRKPELDNAKITDKEEVNFVLATNSFLGMLAE